MKKTCLTRSLDVLKKHAPFASICIATALCTGCMSYKPLDVNPKVLLHESSENFRDTKAGSSRETPVSLSLYDIRELALAGNPDIKVARADAKIAAWMQQFAGRPDDPEFDFSVLRILESADNPLVWTAGLSFAVPLSGRLRAARDLAHSETVVAIHGLAVEENNLIADVTRAHHAYSKAAFLYQAATEIEALDGNWTLPQESREELLATMDDAKEEIRELLGLLPDVEFDINPSFKVDDIALPGSFDELVDLSIHLNHRHAEFEASDMAVRLAVREQYPDLNLGPLFELDEGTGKLGIGVSFPIPLFGHGKAAVREAMAGREVVYRELGAEIISVYRAYTDLLEQATELDPVIELPEISRLHESHGADAFDVYRAQIGQAHDLANHMTERGLILAFPITKLHDPVKLIEE